MIPFKPPEKKRSFSFTSNFSSFTVAFFASLPPYLIQQKKNLEKCICCNLSIYGSESRSRSRCERAEGLAWERKTPLRTEKSVKLNLWTSITQVWATGHVGLQLSSCFEIREQQLKENPSAISIQSRWCWIKSQEINFTLVSLFCPFLTLAVWKTIMIKIGFSSSDSFAKSRSIERESSLSPRISLFYWGGNLLSMGHSTIPFSLLDRIQKNFNLQIGMEKETIEEINKMSNPYLNSFRMSLFIHDRDICLILLRFTNISICIVD